MPEPTPPYAPPRAFADIREELEHGLVPVAQDVRLHYVVAGEGEPVVLMPGWPQSWYAWRYMIPMFVAAGRRVYAIDPRGFGDSDMPSAGYDLATAAADLHAFIEQLSLAGDDGVDIVSHDTGSWIAHALAAEYPRDVRRLVLSDAYIPGVSPDPPAGYPDISMVHRQWHFYFNRVEGLPEALIHGREREFLSWFFGPAKLARTWTIDSEAFDEYLRVFSKPGAVRAGLQYYRHVLSPAGRKASAERTTRPLPMPILTLGGEYADADNLFHTMRRFSNHVHNQVFAGIGHHLPEECPEEMFQAIERFWRDTPCHTAEPQGGRSGM
ncbi:alpha/beta fold hydrolase [Streptomyces sp. NPDC001984]|uniref:alpha/beta fold hydrolase n=1 Tax=Streptomyces sp. NPDC002619 TaxID=3364655 RepID=UPI0036A3EA71